MEEISEGTKKTMYYWPHEYKQGFKILIDDLKTGEAHAETAAFDILATAIHAACMELLPKHSQRKLAAGAGPGVTSRVHEL